jgi:peptidyl-prolyl cis-trans isomerase SurA
MMKRLARPTLIPAALILTLIAPPSLSPAAAQNTLRAAAVVNDEVISMLDLAMRTRLAILASGLQDSPEARNRLQQQVLRSLIDERLQLQEAKRLDISVEKDQLQGAVDQIAKQNKMSREQFLALLTRNDILPSALLDQIKGELTWQGVIQRRLRPTVEISDEEIDDVVTRLQTNQGRMRLRVSEILLAVDNVLQDDDVRRAAERLVEQLRQGARFEALARQFSQSATASVGGDLGWVEEEQLPDELAEALSRMRPGQMNGPISTFGGYYILLLRDKRRVSAGDATLTLKQILFAVPANASAQEVQQAVAKAVDVRSQISGCEGVDELARTYGSEGSGDLGTVKLSQLPEALRGVVGPLEIGRPSDPTRMPTGISILLVCSREYDDVDRERIRESLISQRLNMLARRYLRDLRRTASVDIRR